MKKIKFRHADGIELGQEQTKIQAESLLVDYLLITNIMSTVVPYDGHVKKSFILKVLKRRETLSIFVNLLRLTQPLDNTSIHLMFTVVLLPG